MKTIATLAVYGNFKEKDIKIKFFVGSGTDQYKFQNVLQEAGYDCLLFSVNDVDLEEEA